VVTPQREEINMNTIYQTVADAAETVGRISGRQLSYRQLSNYVQEGKIPSERMGHIRILKRTDIEKFAAWYAVNGGRWAR
jgi:hypothetical protein